MASLRGAGSAGVREGIDAVAAHGEPQLRGAAAAGQLEASVVQVDPPAVRTAGLGVAQVFGMHREGPFEGAGVGDPQTADVVGLEEPLVRVEDEGIGEVEVWHDTTAVAAVDERGRPAEPVAS